MAGNGHLAQWIITRLQLSIPRMRTEIVEVVVYRRIGAKLKEGLHLLSAAVALRLKEQGTISMTLNH